jgi:hypothetical protein
MIVTGTGNQRGMIVGHGLMAWLARDPKPGFRLMYAKSISCLAGD